MFGRLFMNSMMNSFAMTLFSGGFGWGVPQFMVSPMMSMPIFPTQVQPWGDTWHSNNSSNSSNTTSNQKSDLNTAKRLYSSKYRIEELEDGTIYAVNTKTDEVIRAASAKDFLDKLAAKTNSTEEADETTDETAEAAAKPEENANSAASPENITPADPVTPETPAAETHRDPAAPVTPTAKKKTGGIPEHWLGAGTNYTFDNGHIQQNTMAHIRKNLKVGQTPEQVLEILIDLYKNSFDSSKITNDQKKELADQLLRLNPSIFENGKVKNGALFKKLTFPGQTYFVTTYGKATVPANGYGMEKKPNIGREYETKMHDGREYECRYIRYNGTNNKIRKANFLGVFDTNAIFEIGSKNFYLMSQYDNDYRNYLDITGQNRYGKMKLIDPKTGHFNADATDRYTWVNRISNKPMTYTLVNMNNKDEKYTIFLENGKVYMQKAGDKNAPKYGMDDVMCGKYDAQINAGK